jgi:hypothetical protein
MWSLIVEFFIIWVVESAILFAVINRKSRWIKRAHRLARESGIELPSRLEDRVARRLRNEFLVFFAVYPLAFLPMWLLSIRTAYHGATHWTTWFPWLCVAAARDAGLLQLRHRPRRALEQPRLHARVALSTNQWVRPLP